MLTAREFMIERFPEYESGRGQSGHDDAYQEVYMEEYAKYVQACHLKELQEILDLMSEVQLIGYNSRAEVRSRLSALIEQMKEK